MPPQISQCGPESPSVLTGAVQGPCYIPRLQSEKLRLRLVWTLAQEQVRGGLYRSRDLGTVLFGNIICNHETPEPLSAVRREPLAG